MLERILGYDTAYYTRLIDNFAVLAEADYRQKSKKRKRGNPKGYHS